MGFNCIALITVAVLVLGQGAFSSILDVETDVTFRLFTQQNVDEFQYLGFDAENLTNSYYDIAKDTKFITHGFLNNGSGSSCIAIKDAYLALHDVNVIIVDYKKIASDVIITQPKEKIIMVGEYTATFIDFLIEQGAKLSQFHLMGHSLGAHVIGYAAMLVKSGKIPRVTGLDPGFMAKSDETLSENSAEFVDVIHTCRGFYAVIGAVGHADFFPNGGWNPQPGCGLLGYTCSHYEAYRFFVRSIFDEHKYVGYICDSESDLEDGLCEENETAYMGIATPSTARGSYYLETQKES